jgi:hypothetical protein
VFPGEIRSRIVEGFRCRNAARQRLAAVVPLHRRLALLNGELLVALSSGDDHRLHDLIGEAGVLNTRLMERRRSPDGD